MNYLLPILSKYMFMIQGRSTTQNDADDKVQKMSKLFLQFEISICQYKYFAAVWTSLHNADIKQSDWSKLAT